MISVPVGDLKDFAKSMNKLTLTIEELAKVAK